MEVIHHFFELIQESLVNTFVVDNRYMIFFKGLGNTLLIAAGALVLGVIIGVFVAISKVYYYQAAPMGFWQGLKQFFKTGRFFFLNQAFMTLWDNLLTLYLTFFRGTPVVVQLMIWAFVVFSTANELIVAIIGFGVNSGAYVSEIVRAGIMAVDKGQTEAGRSLGLSASQTMRKIVLPQAVKNILPALGNEGISLIKETSIVGYIAVIDLTKAAALVRARTFDPFAPLLVVAAVYLFMVIVLSYLLKKLERRLQASDRR